MRIIVTGGAGFIGSALVRQLVKDKHEVIVWDDLSAGTSFRELEKLKGVKCRKVDIADQDERRAAIWAARKVDAVYHLAAVSSIGACIKDPLRAYRVNVTATEMIARMCAANGADRLIFASSAAVYPPKVQAAYPYPVPAGPVGGGFYGATKLMGEQAVKQAAGLVDVSIMRFFNVYGPGQSTTAEGGVVALFMEAAKRGGKLLIRGSGGQCRDFVYVDDIVAALVRLLGPFDRPKYKEPGAGEYTLMNVGTGEATTISGLAAFVIKLCKKGKMASVEGDPGALYSAAGFSTGNREAGFKPQVSLEAGLRKMLRRSR